MPKQQFCQRIYSLNTYRRAYGRQHYNVLKGVEVNGEPATIPVADISFTRKIPIHAAFLGYFDRLHFDVPEREGKPHEDENRPVDIPFTTLCSVWADPGQMTVYVISDRSPEETAPFSTWGDERIVPVHVTHAQLADHNKRCELMRQYKELLKTYKVDTVPSCQ